MGTFAYPYLSRQFSYLLENVARERGLRFNEITLQRAFGSSLAQRPTELLFFLQMAHEASNTESGRVCFFYPNAEAFSKIPSEALFHRLAERFLEVFASRGAASVAVSNGTLATVAFLLLSLCWREVISSIPVLRRHGAFLGSGQPWLSVVEGALGGPGAEVPQINGFARSVWTQARLSLQIVSYRLSQRADEDIWKDFCFAFENYVREKPLDVLHISPGDFIAELHMFYMANAYNFGLPTDAQGSMDFLVGQDDRARTLLAELRQKAVRGRATPSSEDMANSWFGEMYPQIKMATMAAYVTAMHSGRLQQSITFSNLFAGSIVVSQPHLLLGAVQTDTLANGLRPLCFINENFPDFPFLPNGAYGAIYFAFREHFSAALASVGPEKAASLEDSIAIVLGSYLLCACTSDPIIAGLIAKKSNNSSGGLIACHHEYLRRLEAVLSVRSLPPVASPYAYMTMCVEPDPQKGAWRLFCVNFMDIVLIDDALNAAFRANAFETLLAFYRDHIRRTHSREANEEEGIEFLIRDGRFRKLITKFHLLSIDRMEAGSRFIIAAGAVVPIVAVKRSAKFTASFQPSLPDETAASFGLRALSTAGSAAIPIPERPPNYRAGGAIHAGTYRYGNLLLHLWDRGGRGDCLFAVVAGQDPSLEYNSDSTTLCRLKLYSQEIADIAAKLETLLSARAEPYGEDVVIGSRIRAMVTRLKNVRNMQSYNQIRANAGELEQFVVHASEEILWYELAQEQRISGDSDVRRAANDLLTSMREGVGSASYRDGVLKNARNVLILQMARHRFQTFPALAASAELPQSGRLDTLFSRNIYKDVFVSRLKLALANPNAQHIADLCETGYLMDLFLLQKSLAESPDPLDRSNLEKISAVANRDTTSHSPDDRVLELRSIARAAKIPLPWIGYGDLAYESPFEARLFSAGKGLRLQTAGRTYVERMLTPGFWRNDATTRLGRLMWHLTHGIIQEHAWVGDCELVTVCRATEMPVFFMSTNEQHMHLAVPQRGGEVAIFVLYAEQPPEDPNRELSNAPWSTDHLMNLWAACAATGYTPSDSAFDLVFGELFTADGGGPRALSYRELLRNLGNDRDLLDAVIEENQGRIISINEGFVRHIFESGNYVGCLNKGGSHWLQPSL
ncbi:MAG: hypothetical protein LBF24_01770 [Puniceicoccales bacterium]|jgi:hypothetical protein|nr:hypothetical protein [Puniceicoccales bacterium]